MRLTLRTLLSWKDGMLEAESARDLAGKVEASEAARGLVERIDEVVARPTLSAPPIDATAFAAAANTTAEYLDNALPAEHVGDFERVCYASETQLAETAAVHEILASLTRTPPPALDAATRRRLRAAMEARRERGDRGGAMPDQGGSWGDDRRFDGAPTLRPAVRVEPAAFGGSRRAARAPLSAWLLVITAVVLLAALVGVLGWSLSKGRPQASARRDVATRPAAEPAAGPDPVAGPARGAEPVPEPAVRDEPAISADPAAMPAAAAPAAPVFAPDPPAPAGVSAERFAAAAAPSPAAGPTADDLPPFAAIDPQAPGEGGGELSATVTADVPASGGGDQPVPYGNALAIAAPRAAAQPAAAPASNASAAPAVAVAAEVGGSGAVIFRPTDDSAQAWLAVARSGKVPVPADVVAPPFCRPELVIDGVRIALEPGTRAALRRDAAGVVRLEIVFGRAVAAGEGRLGLTAGLLAGCVTCSPAAPVSVGVDLVRHPGGAADSTERMAWIAPTAGPLAWQTTTADGAAGDSPLAGVPAEVNIPAGQGIVWRSAVPDAAAIAPPPAGAAGRPSDDAIDRWAAPAVAQRCGAGTAALPALRELAADRRIEHRMAAAAALAMIGEFDELARLVSADAGESLRQEQWARLEREAVQPALARGPKAADALAAAFTAHAPPGAAPQVVRFARGFSDDELAAGAAAELVAALESPHLVVRRYAIKNLVEVTGVGGAERLRYRADWTDESLRKDGWKWWSDQLRQGRVRRGAAGR